MSVRWVAVMAVGVFVLASSGCGGESAAPPPAPSATPSPAGSPSGAPKTVQVRVLRPYLAKARAVRSFGVTLQRTTVADGETQHLRIDGQVRLAPTLAYTEDVTAPATGLPAGTRLVRIGAQAYLRDDGDWTRFSTGLTGRVAELGRLTEAGAPAAVLTAMQAAPDGLADLGGRHYRATVPAADLGRPARTDANSVARGVTEAVYDIWLARTGLPTRFQIVYRTPAGPVSTETGRYRDLDHPVTVTPPAHISGTAVPGQGA